MTTTRYSRTILAAKGDKGKKIGEIVEIGAIRYRVAKEISRAEFDKLVEQRKLKANRAVDIDATGRRTERPVDPGEDPAAQCQRFYRLTRIAEDAG